MTQEPTPTAESPELDARLQALIDAANRAGALSASFSALSAEDSETTAAAQAVVRQRHEQLQQTVSILAQQINNDLAGSQDPTDQDADETTAEDGETT